MNGMVIGTISLSASSIGPANAEESLASLYFQPMGTDYARDVLVWSRDIGRGLEHTRSCPPNHVEVIFPLYDARWECHRKPCWLADNHTLFADHEDGVFAGIRQLYASVV